MHRLLRSISLISLVSLAGCTTWDQVTAGVDTFKGRSYKEAFAALGFPDQEQKIAGQTVYIWSDSYTGSYSAPTTTTATTYVAGRPIYTTVNGSERRTYNANCELKLVVNPAGTVVEVDLEGNLRGCGEYARFAPRKKSA